MWDTVRVLGVVAFGLLLVGGAGCSRGNRTRTRASGAITLNGQPLKGGKITFRAVGAGPLHSDTVTDGRYAIRSRYPLTPGGYDVTIEYPGGNAGGRGYDRRHAERVTLLGLGKDVVDFRLR